MRLVIADQHQLFRDCLAAVLAEGQRFEVVGKVSNGREALERLGETRVDILLVSLDPADGICGLIREIEERSPASKVVLLGRDDSEERVLDCLQAGACGYLVRDQSLADLRSAIEAVSQGDTVCTPRIANSLFNRLARLGRERRRRARLDYLTLTPREARDPRPHLRGAEQPGDRARALPVGAHGQEPRPQDPGDTRGAQPLGRGAPRRGERMDPGPEAAVRAGIFSGAGHEPFLGPPVHCRVQPERFTSLYMQSSIRVVVVSEERMFREAVAASVAGYEGLEAAGDGQEEGVDVVLIDAASDLQAGLRRTWEARERWPEARLIALGLDREDDSVDFIEAGVQGYVLKGASPDSLVEVIRSVHQGRTPCSPRVVASVLARISVLSSVKADPLPQSVEPLTLREREVLGLLAAGLGNKEVGRRLRITVQTVKNHVHRILEKLQVHRRREAVRLAYDLGLLAEPREIPHLWGQSREQRTFGLHAAGPFDGGEKA